MTNEEKKKELNDQTVGSEKDRFVADSSDFKVITNKRGKE